MKNRTLITLFIAILLLAACAHEPKQEALSEEKALEFLYQYMPLGDSVDYAEDYYKECVRYAFKAKTEMPWGDSIPEREFKHFVLPPRVNNENLDRFRATYYEELKARVQNLSLYDAVLEVNHWCHEHVSYKGSDSRTSAPMATIKTSWGRCGEESTLLVTALRTIGIPARQVYTPRWAHCDDNHAWVEAWVDGKWHFLGACEPEPVLDLGWFNEPASRALLLHTRVFGDYDGPEEVISRNNYYTEINVVDNYGKTAKTTFTVVDAEGTPQPGLTVEFKIYNYAEFCTVVHKTTDENGQTWLTAGLGCMMAYAAKDGKFGFQMFKPGEQDEVTITIDHDFDEGIAEPIFELDMVPPVPSALSPEVTPEMRAENDRRIAYEDSLRNAYIVECQAAQRESIMGTGNKTLCRIYEKTWGNCPIIGDFVKYAQEQKKETKAVNLLQGISDKDLRDIGMDALRDHFDHTPDLTSSVISMPPELYQAYILSPRISNEMIVPWRKTMTEFFPEDERQRYHDDPALLAEWVRQNITVDDELNPQRVPISPLGVLKARKADCHSRDIFFVAMARSLGIAAQINPVNGNVQYNTNNKWINTNLNNEIDKTTNIGYLDIHYKLISFYYNPKYYTHFSIKKFNGKSFQLLAYDAQDPGIDDGMTLSMMEHPLPLEAGHYILTSGTRLDDGTALTHSEFFTIEAGHTTQIELVMRRPQAKAEVVGHLNVMPEFVEGNGYYILGYLDHGSEPTTHAMRDIATFRNDFEACGVPIFFAFGNDNDYENYLMKHFDDLPEGTSPFIDEDGAVLKNLVESLSLKRDVRPIFIIANEQNEVILVKQGYSIGLGEQILKTL